MTIYMTLTIIIGLRPLVISVQGVGPLHLPAGAHSRGGGGV